MDKKEKMIALFTNYFIQRWKNKQASIWIKELKNWTMKDQTKEIDSMVQAYPELSVLVLQHNKSLFKPENLFLFHICVAASYLEKHFIGEAVRRFVQDDKKWIQMQTQKFYSIGWLIKKNQKKKKETEDKKKEIEDKKKEALDKKKEEEVEEEEMENEDEEMENEEPEEEELEDEEMENEEEEEEMENEEEIENEEELTKEEEEETLTKEEEAPNKEDEEEEALNKEPVVEGTFRSEGAKKWDKNEEIIVHLIGWKPRHSTK